MRYILKVLLVFALLSLLYAGSGLAEPPKAILLLAAQSEQGITRSYGPGAQDAGPLSRAMRAPFEEAGISFLSAASLIPPTASAAQELPLSDSVATQMAREAGAGIAVVAYVNAKDQGALRATQLVGQLVRAHVRVIDVTAGRTLFDNKAEFASYGKSASVARALAGTKALTKASRGLGNVLLTQWRPQTPNPGRLSLAVSGAPGWRSVAAVIRRLAATRGVSGVHLQRIHPDRVLFSLQSKQGAASVVASLRRARIHEGSVAVQLSGSAIVLRVIMSSSVGGIPNG